MGPLETLGLSPGCSLEDAKSRWRLLILQIHPDHNKNNSQKFLDVQKAYEAIKEDPSLLDGKKTPTTNFLLIEVPVSIEDFYFYREVPVQISRQVFCSHCNGTGSESKEAGFCSHCEGSGKIKSSVLKLMNRDDVCPVCLGVGVPRKNLCSKCRGQKYEIDSSTRKIKFSLKDYHKRILIIQGAGHQLSRNTYGNVSIKLSIKYDDKVIIEDMYFRTNYKVLPIQRIVGDEAEITVFGRRLKFRIDKNATETVIEDRVSPGVTRSIRVIFVDTPPVLMEETIVLYRKILEIEKQTSL